MLIIESAGAHNTSFHLPDATNTTAPDATKTIDPGLLSLDRRDTLRGTGLERGTLAIPSGEVADALGLLEAWERASKNEDFDEQEWIADDLDSNAGSGIERLLALLLSLLRLVAKVSTEQTRNAAQMGILSTKLAEQSGAFSVNSATSNLWGAVAALGVGAIVTGIGAKSSIRATSININNMKKNAAELDKLRLQSTQMENEAASLVTPTGLDKSSHAERCDRAVLQDNARKINSSVAALAEQQQLVRMNADRKQIAGGALMGISYPASALAVAGFGLKSGTEKAESTITDSQKEVASGLQRTEEQTAQQKLEFVAKLLALALAAQDSNMQLLSTLPQGFKV